MYPDKEKKRAKTVKQITIVGSLVAIATFLITFGYYGGFKSYDIKIEEQGGELLIYKDIRVASYSYSAVVLDSILIMAKRKGIEPIAGFGIYYDNPHLPGNNLLHSEVGFIMSQEDIDSTFLSSLSKEYNIRIFPKGEYLTVNFPYKGRISAIVGIIKILPAINRYLRNNNLPDDGFIMQIYNSKEKKIFYRKKI